MLFNSYEFIFFFMPVTVLSYAVLSEKYHSGALAWLTASSLAFYVCWEPRTSWVLVVSLAFNYCVGWKINESQGSTARLFLIVGVTPNLLLLGIFKYAAFAVDIINLVAGPCTLDL
jgi:alginate O-acetyltransferase complex protein AlgI